MSKHDYHDPHHGLRETYRDLEIEQNQDRFVRDRIAEVLRKYNVTLEPAPLDALTMAMRRLGAEYRSLLKPATVAKAPDITTPGGAKRASENAVYYRNTLKPFA